MGVLDAAYALSRRGGGARFFAGGTGDMRAYAEARHAVEQSARAGELLGGTPRPASAPSSAGVASFESPLARWLPRESASVGVMVVEPPRGAPLAGVCVHLAATGLEGFGWRRRLVAEPLAERCGVASLILEHPLYGSRRPEGAASFHPRTVADFLLAGVGACAEAAAALRWARQRYPGVPAGLAGSSMGGAMALGAAFLDLSPEPLALSALMGSSSAGALVRGAMRAEVEVPDGDEAALLRTLDGADFCATDAPGWVRARFPDKRVAAVCAWARHDRIVPPAEARRLGDAARALASPGLYRGRDAPGGHVSAFAMARLTRVPWALSFPRRAEEAFSLLRLR